MIKEPPKMKTLSPINTNTILKNNNVTPIARLIMPVLKNHGRFLPNKKIIDIPIATNEKTNGRIIGI